MICAILELFEYFKSNFIVLKSSYVIELVAENSSSDLIDRFVLCVSNPL